MYVNRSKAKMRGRMISPEYMAWRNEAQGVLYGYNPLPRILGPVAVCMDCGETKGLSDLDGRWKAVLDLLVRHEIIQNDDRRYVRLLLATWNKDRKDCRVTITTMSEQAKAE